MPPLPKRKYPKSRQGKRRSHLRMRMPHVIECPRCKSPRQAHHACPICGTYRGREVIALPTPDLED
jgi:large subunit ribosomal protein L32